MNEDLRFQELLDRWAKGEVTLADEQELLALSRDDDFRKEALDGLWSTPAEPHAQHLASLKTRIQAKNQQKRRFIPLPFLMAIAAVSITVVAAIWFFSNRPAAELPIAEQVASPKPESNTRDTNQNQDAIALLDQKKTTPALSNGPDYNRSLDNIPGSKTDRIAKTDHAVNALEADESRTMQDIAGNQEAENADFAKEQKKAEITQAPAAAPAKPILTPEASKEAVATQKATSDKAPARAKDASELISDALRDYIRRNARLTEAARNQNITGTVRLQFDVNAAGKAENIVVLKGLGYGCDEIAQKLLRAWDFPTGNKRSGIELEIPFVR
ncbi:MAG: TonB family protein [Saprospiraceae bacterium]|nr:TonB family protein [Saprospiraceae bacterium]